MDYVRIVEAEEPIHATENTGSMRRCGRLAPGVVLLSVASLAVSGSILFPDRSPTIATVAGLASLSGGLGAYGPVDFHLQGLCDGVRQEAQEKLQASGWNGVFTEFKVVDARKQVVAGMNYFVKVQISENEFIMLRIFEPLPYTKEKPELAAVKLTSARSKVEYFDRT
mmetsp:Transcript_25090/g.49131  ORF Transcript_25090/g.49131 Transcript_25090/m.49131 type:complete len:168 (+) Transcript_25090:106-609(+)